MSGRYLFFSVMAIICLILFFGIFKVFELTLVSHEGQTSEANLILSEHPKYDRSAFGRWTDADGDCLNTRNELLKEQSEISVTLDASGCKIISGRWIDIYSGHVLNNSKNIDVDHIVPLNFAWKAGAWNWTDMQRSQFYNDEENVILTGSSNNRKKGDSSPLEWMPEKEAFRCQYVSRFMKILSKYSLVTSKETTEHLEQIRDVSCN